MHPTDIAVEEGALRIDWQDGSRSIIPLVTLRQSCGCTTCRTRQGMRNALYTPALSEDAYRVRDLLLVSSSLLRVVWEDGHDRSLYRFSELRTLVPLSTPPLR